MKVSMLNAGISKLDLVHYLTTAKYKDYRVFKHALKGRTLWIVYEFKNEITDQLERHLLCFQLFEEDGAWDNNVIHTSENPPVYNCPLAFLDMVPPNGDEEWRKIVLARASKKNELQSKLSIGAKVRLVAGCKFASVPVEEVEIKNLKPLMASIGEFIFRLPRKFILEMA